METKTLHLDVPSLVDTLGNSLYFDLAAQIVPLVGAVAGLTGVAVKGLQAWLAEKQSRKVRVRYKDIELEVNGAMKLEELEAALEIFKKFTAEPASDVLTQLHIEVVNQLEKSQIAK